MSDCLGESPVHEDIDHSLEATLYVYTKISGKRGEDICRQSNPHTAVLSSQPDGHIQTQKQCSQVSNSNNSAAIGLNAHTITPSQSPSRQSIEMVRYEESGLEKHIAVGSISLGLRVCI